MARLLSYSPNLVPGTARGAGPFLSLFIASQETSALWHKATRTFTLLQRLTEHIAWNDDLLTQTGLDILLSFHIAILHHLLYDNLLTTDDIDTLRQGRTATHAKALATDGIDLLCILHSVSLKRCHTRRTVIHYANDE